MQPAVPDVYMDGGVEADVAAFQEHQQTAARLDAATAARTWTALAKHATLSTLSVSKESPGFPNASVVEFVVDGAGRPVLAVSGMSLHTADMMADGRAALTVTTPGFASLADGRVTLQGRMRALGEQERAPLRDAFLQKYPYAFWVDFADFKWLVMEEVAAVRYNGGFGLAGKVTPQQYLAAAPDPVAQFSGPVCGHMNADHMQDSIAMLCHATGLRGVTAARLLGLDRLGMDMEVSRAGQSFKARLPFSTPADNRKAIKDAIVEMTKAARVAAKNTAQQQQQPQPQEQ